MALNGCSCSLSHRQKHPVKQGAFSVSLVGILLQHIMIDNYYDRKYSVKGGAKYG